jgi:cell division protein FtsB
MRTRLTKTLGNLAEKARVLRNRRSTQQLQRAWMPAASAVVILSLLVLGLAGDNGYVERRAQRQQIEALADEIEHLRQENLQLGQTVKSLRSDPQAIEELARERLRLGRPNEVIITLPRDEPQGTAPTASTTR